MTILSRLLTTLLLPILFLSLEARAANTRSCAVTIDNSGASKHEKFFIDEYRSQSREQYVLFSAHNSVVDDNQLKGFYRELERGLTAHRRGRITLQVRAKIEQMRTDLKRDQKLLQFIKEEHTKSPFLYLAGEFSQEKAHRFKKRIEFANFVARELVIQTELKKEEVVSFLLLLTGEDVFALLDGQLLADLPIYPTEVQSEMDESGQKLGACFGIMGSLEFSQKPKALELVKKVSAFYRPDIEQKGAYLKVKAEVIEALENDGLMRLRLGIEEKAKVAEVVSNCDALFNLERDQTVAQKMRSLPEGRGIITRGIGHRHLLKEAFLNSCSP